MRSRSSQLCDESRVGHARPEARLELGERGHDRFGDVLAAEVFAGDLLENGAPPYFGDGFPMDWPATVEAMLDLVGDTTRVVPGHGDVAARDFVLTSLEQLRGIATLARRIHAGEVSLDDGLADPSAPWGGGPLIRDALDRALGQARRDRLSLHRVDRARKTRAPDRSRLHVATPESPGSSGGEGCNSSSRSSQCSIGAAFCFGGYRFFLLLLPLWGFLVGFNVGTDAVSAIFGDGTFATATSWVVGFVLALVFAAFSYFWYWVAIALLADPWATCSG